MEATIILVAFLVGFLTCFLGSKYFQREESLFDSSLLGKINNAAAHARRLDARIAALEVQNHSLRSIRWYFIIGEPQVNFGVDGDYCLDQEGCRVFRRTATGWSLIRREDGSCVYCHHGDTNPSNISTEGTTGDYYRNVETGEMFALRPDGVWESRGVART